MTVFPIGLHPLGHAENRTVIDAAKVSDVKIYLVGGYIRDSLLGIAAERMQPLDFDYTVVGSSAINFAQQVANLLRGHFVLLDESSDTARVVLDEGVMFDFAGCVGGSLHADILRRDFTVNALAWDPFADGEIIDLVGGLEDIQHKQIRAISESNFVDDPLRLLRAFRLCTTIGGTIEPKTLKMIEQHAWQLPQAAAERISYELFRIMESKHSSSVVRLMWDTGILEAIFPELTDTRKVTTNAFHHLALWEHTLELVSQAELKLKGLPEFAVNSYNQELCAGVSRLAATKIACLLHDIGKPGTWAITPEGRHTFYAHDKLGADMTEVVAVRLRWARPIERFIVKLVRWHLRPGQLFHQGPPSARALHRFYRAIGNDVPELILLAFADLAATCGEGIEGPQKDALVKSLHELLDGFPVFQSSQQSMVRWLDGKQVMRMLNLQPGPILGELLGALEEATGLGEVNSLEQAQKFVLDIYKTKYSS